MLAMMNESFYATFFEFELATFYELFYSLEMVVRRLQNTLNKERTSIRK